jgi:hypothetical protein
MSTNQEEGGETRMWGREKECRESQGLEKKQREGGRGRAKIVEAEQNDINNEGYGVEERNKQRSERERDTHSNQPQ